MLMIDNLMTKLINNTKNKRKKTSYRINIIHIKIKEETNNKLLSPNKFKKRSILIKKNE